MPPDDIMALDVQIWADALVDVPTQYIPELWRRAILNKSDDYPVRTFTIKREWDALKDELRMAARAHAQERAALLEQGHGAIMGEKVYIDEFRAAHNLPLTWQLGDPYPPESDLYGKEGRSLDNRKEQVIREQYGRHPYTGKSEPYWHASRGTRGTRAGWERAGRDSGDGGYYEGDAEEE